jgi:NTE family protein
MSEAGTRDRFSGRRKFAFALQSSFCDGAVGWGVLDRLLEDDRIEVEGFSGASSGTSNGLSLAHGLTVGGRSGARETLERFWRTASQRMNAIAPMPPVGVVFGHSTLELLPQYWAMETLAHITSPYFWNPANFNVMRHVFAEVIDFERLRRESAIKIFISATDILGCKERIFTRKEISVDAAVASTSVPLYLHPQYVENKPYWDGGFVGAPRLQPLVEHCEAEDIIFLRTSPTERPRATLPMTSFDIHERQTELAVAVPVDQEVRHLRLIRQWIDEGRLKPGDGVRRVDIHVIDATSGTRDLPYSTKYQADWGFLTHLRDHGRHVAESWLADRFGAQGAERRTANASAKDKALASA